VEQSPLSDPIDPSALLFEGALEIGIPLSSHVAARLVLYLKELQRWNAKMNLTAIEQERDIIAKHFLDSLAAFKVFNPRPGLSILDVGTGAGFPGMVLKLQAPELAVTLLEPSTKKAAFLHHLIGILGITGMAVVTQRLEHFDTEKKYDVITTRAVNSTIVLDQGPKFLVQGGRILLFRVTPLEQSPKGYVVIAQVSFPLPFSKTPRTLTVLRSQ
jgi:16S rRNA (guanine527-N7)-methyltransferase